MNTYSLIYEQVKRIPKGKVATYGMIAALAGNIRWARIVGYALHVNPSPGEIPCHRIVNRYGETASAFAFGGSDIQRELLENEGVNFLPDGRVDLDGHLINIDDLRLDFDNMGIREIKESDYSVMEDFLYHAIFIPEGEKAPSKDIIWTPEIHVYIKGFDVNNPGDCGVIAEKEGKIIGAAWTRIIPAYGSIDKEMPELAISVLPEYRGRKIGTHLIVKLFELLSQNGFKRTSLSVQKDNPAVRLYQRMGYKITDEKFDHAGNEDYIMVRDLY